MSGGRRRSSSTSEERDEVYDDIVRHQPAV